MKTKEQHKPYDRVDGQDYGERQIIIRMIVDTEYLKRVERIWQDEYIQSPEILVVAHWCLDHLAKYHEAPNRLIESMYMDALRQERITKEEGDIIERILTKAGTEYDGPSDTEYHYRLTFEYFHQRRTELTYKVVTEHIEHRDWDQAGQTMLAYQPLLDGQDDSLATMTMRRPRWLWERIIPLGKFTLVAGHPDLGKSTILLDLGARVTSGGKAPDGSRMVHGAFLLAATEDDYEDTIVPRLAAMGANLELCFPIGSKAYDIKALSKEIDGRIKTLNDRRIRTRLVGIDPLASYMGERVNTRNDTSVRVALRPLIEVCQQHRLALIGLRHLRKAGTDADSKGAAMDLVTESKAFVAISRAAYLIWSDPEDDTRQLMLRMRNALSPPTKTGLAYRLVTEDIWVRTQRGRETIEASKVHWLDDEITMTADEAVIGRGKAKAKLEKAMEWLREVLSVGAMPATWILEVGKLSGFKERMIRDAAKKLDVQHTKTGFGKGAMVRWALRS
jgi:hypothetical protein